MSTATTPVTPAGSASVSGLQLGVWRAMRAECPTPSAVVDELCSLVFLPLPVRIGLLVDVAREAADEAGHLAGLLAEGRPAVPLPVLDQLVTHPGDVTTLVTGGFWTVRRHTAEPSRVPADVSEGS